MRSHKYVIIGGGIAGGRATEGIRRLDAQGSLVLVTREPYLPYQRPPLSKGYLTGKETLAQVYLREDTYYALNTIDVLRGVAACELDPEARRVTLEDGQVLEYEKLLLATGGQARRLPIPGHDLAGVYALRTIADCDAIRAEVAGGKAALIIGGSFIGCEIAASLTQLGLRVSMVFPEARPLERVAPPEMSAMLRRKFESRGVRILPGVTPQSLEGDAQGHVARARLSSGETLDVGLVVMGVGITLDTNLARAAGLALDERGAVLVDANLRTSDPSIYAAGDIVAWPDPTFGKRLRVEHWDVARQQGTRAGRNMAGEGKPYVALPYFYSDLFDLSYEAWGDLSVWEQTVLRGQFDGPSFTLFYFAQGKLSGVLTVGRPEEERKQMQALVKARVAFGAVAAKLADQSASLV